MTLKAERRRKVKWKEKTERRSRKEEDESGGQSEAGRATETETGETVEEQEEEKEKRTGVSRNGRMAVKRKERKTEKEVATLEEDRLFEQKVGYPTSRRPIDYKRGLSTKPWEVVEKWFSTFNFTIGPKANDAMRSTDRTMAEMTARLFYTWRDLFVEDMVEIPATDLVTHTNPTREDAVPRRALR